MKNVYGSFEGNDVPRSSERSGKRSSSPATTESAEPSTLESAVVAAAVVAGIRHDRDGSAFESENRCGGVDVTGIGDPAITLIRAGGKNRGDFAAADPPDDVEVVDRAVAEDAAGVFDVRDRRGSRIEGGRSESVDPTEFSGSNCVVRRHK